ncbi:CRISPR-associated protein Cas10/Cmr2, subtype III-B (plasmid) [Nostoc sp. PCC 7524]|uniref:type III-B CRISPR-associated protein Cas10/Cmr2 n=1 Tax=Nostoc sp. (strain ATCC 29411 / PCC 7524) TaxID=28072 RepID=UPI00029F0A40|nr:type III-B CRISPR-associated protein Cas10/Cmr2 [Nostoc sp. PCC 7524]AFY51318.1 CRISPR-associated protein Cas10/Cmr2, subtype III-B [Nostoc sp. PCC 7524]
MSEEYWRAKIWGLLHDPMLKALHNNSGRGRNSFFEQLQVMQPWIEAGRIPGSSQSFLCQHLLIADYLTSASDRSAIGSTTTFVNYAPSTNPEQGLQITHLLSAKKQNFKVNFHEQLISSKRADFLFGKEEELLKIIPAELQDPIIQENLPKIKQLYWWLWRCLPQATCELFGDSSLMLMPAETRIPDASIWSHVSMTAALAGGFAGYDLTLEEVKKWPSNKDISHPYLAVFSFTPVQELIKSSRKMRDFWAGSWLLHYLSAKVCWVLANQYGPDTLLYPSLYQQPLIDHWLLQKYPEFEKFIGKVSPESLLTAGFPNIIVLVLPEGRVQAAMQTAQQALLEEWLKIGDLVLKELQNKRHWMKDLDPNHTTWKGWLKSQWQFYWTALPIGKGKEFKTAAIPEDLDELIQPWLTQQNQAYNVSKQQALFQKKELDFLREAYNKRLEEQGRKFSVNVGSWWGYIFDATRAALASVKNARNWEMPTAFGPRSTISGIGSVIHPGKDGKDWITEGETQNYWKHHAGLFDGREQLNATEVVKRGLHKILPDLLGIREENITVSYPDLTSGVAGYLKANQTDTKHKRNFENACKAIVDKFPEAKKILAEMQGKWGIPWIDNQTIPQQYHPRLLNVGWILEDLPNSDELKEEYTKLINDVISQYYPNNNPSNWYVLAAGDGDSMSEWLKGTKLKKYGDYIPDGFAEKVAKSGRPLTKFGDFLELTKRMGPSTHSALSRALLDFSNQLVPYLTQTRYAGRLIYSGGDDVLAYPNLWEWDNWLWDIRQCFRGAEDPHNEFSNDGDYWKYKGKSDQLVDRPLFTMGSAATISFGIVIAHHSVPLAIALESLWEAEEKAKEHTSPNGDQKDAVQVRVLYGNGNTLQSTAKFDVFYQWQQLITGELDSAIFEQAASLWSQHPAPSLEAIIPWTKVFCDRRDQFQNNESAKQEFQKNLADFLKALFITTQTKDLDNEIQSWLKLAAFVKRNREIKLGGVN